MRWFVVLCAAAIVNNANSQTQNYVWDLNSAINDLTVGPDTAVHCQLTNPSGVVVFDEFGPCKVNIERVSTQHAGTWTVSAVGQNNVLPVEDTFHVQLSASTASKPTVTTTVTQEKPLIQLTCSVPVTQPITDCVFRDPSGRVLQARQGVSEDRFSFLEGTTLGVQSCGIEINGPLATDLGLWRCDMQTAADTYYGHITVLCPWAMMDPEIAAAVVSVPTLISQTRDQVVAEGDSVTMSCSIQSPIRYCYFRARNGSIVNVSPGTLSSNFEYVGAGFDAGECGVRFSSMYASDSGNWGCHVGLPDSSEDEQRVQFSITVEERIAAAQLDEGKVVQGIVHGSPALDYCRFVRIDGVGFTSENVPSGYSDASSLRQGLCKITVASPSIVDMHAWTVVAKVTGQQGELARKTDWIIEGGHGGSDNRSAWWLYTFVVPSIVMALLLLVFAFTRHCRWAKETAASLRGSMRRQASPQEVKPPLPPNYNEA